MARTAARARQSNPTAPASTGPEPTLAQTFAETPKAPVVEAHEIPLALIDPSPTQPRQHFDEASLAELGASIAATGLEQPITVREVLVDGAKRYELIFGERRTRASRLVGLTTIRAFVVERDDLAVLVSQLVENNQREDVHPLDEAAAILMLHQRFSLPAREIVLRLGRSASWVDSRLTLGALAPAFQALVRENIIGLGGALLLAKVPSSNVEKADKEIRHRRGLQSGPGRPLTTSDIARMIGDLCRDLRAAPFPLEDERLGDRPCTKCMRRTGAQPSLFGDVEAGDDRCLDAKCWDQKVEEIWNRAQAKASSRRLPVISDRTFEQLSKDGYEDTSAKAYSLYVYDKPLSTFVKEADLTICRSASGRIVEAVAPDVIERLRKADVGCSARDEDDADEELTDEQRAEADAARAERTAKREAEEQERRTKRDRENYENTYPPEFLAKLAKLEHVDTTTLLAYALRHGIQDATMLAMRRGLVEAGASHDSATGQLDAWAENADERDLALALVEDLVIAGMGQDEPDFDELVNNAR